MFYKDIEEIEVRRQNLFIVMNTLLLLFSFNVSAYEVGVEFSADALQVSPGRPPVYSKMYVSKSAVRTEMTQQGRRVIDIAHPKKGKRVLLFPDQKTYMEQTGLVVSSSWSGKSPKTPCEGLQDASCKKLGKEILQKVNVEKWQVERKIKGKTYRSLHWIDANRRIAIKEMLPDGSVSELMMLGKEKLNGRNIEQWELRHTYSSGQNRVSKQWYDTQLKMVIKEEMPGGYLRELNNIKVNKQKKSLFELPKDYVNITKTKKQSK